MKIDFDLVVITADEPYEGLTHTQVMFADFLSQFVDVVFVEAPSPWRPSKLLQRWTQQRLRKNKPTIISYPNLLPARLAIASKINEKALNLKITRIAAANQKQKILIWHFDSYRSLLNASSLKQGRTIKHIYHVIDPFYKNPLDDQLRRLSDLIVVTSPRIAPYYSKQKNKVRLLPQCIDLAATQKMCDLPLTIAVPEQKYFVFLGTISDDVDFSLLRKVAAIAPVLLAGRILKLHQKQKEYETLLNQTPTRYLGLLKPEIFYPLLKGALAGLICYDLSIRTEPFSPLKALNYLAAGRPVLSNCFTELPALQEQIVYERTESAAFVILCQKALAQTLPIDSRALANYLNESSLDVAVGSILEELHSK